MDGPPAGPYAARNDTLLPAAATTNYCPAPKNWVGLFGVLKAKNIK